MAKEGPSRPERPVDRTTKKNPTHTRRQASARQPQRSKKEHSVADNKNQNQKQPRDKEPRKFDYNPGNMSGKTIGTRKNEFGQSDVDRIHDRHEHQDKNKKSAT